MIVVYYVNHHHSYDLEHILGHIYPPVLIIWKYIFVIEITNVNGKYVNNDMNELNKHCEDKLMHMTWTICL